MIFSSILPGVRYKRDTPVVAVLCLIILLAEYHDGGIFPLLRHPRLSPNRNDDIEQPPTQGGITVEGDLDKLRRPDSLSVPYRADGIDLSAPAS